MTRPAPKAAIPKRSYCLMEGWRCTFEARCDEHRPDQDPPRVGELLDGWRP